MRTQGDRQNFLWRPNDNSSTTLTRYDQEAEHWVKAFKNAERKNKPTDYTGTFKIFGLVVSLVILLLTLAGMVIVKVFNWLRS